MEETTDISCHLQLLSGMRMIRALFMNFSWATLMCQVGEMRSLCLTLSELNLMEKLEPKPMMALL